MRIDESIILKRHSKKQNRPKEQMVQEDAKGGEEEREEGEV